MGIPGCTIEGGLVRNGSPRHNTVASSCEACADGKSQAMVPSVLQTCQQSTAIARVGKIGLASSTIKPRAWIFVKLRTSIECVSRWGILYICDERMYRRSCKGTYQLLSTWGNPVGNSNRRCVVKTRALGAQALDRHASRWRRTVRLTHSRRGHCNGLQDIWHKNWRSQSLRSVVIDDLAITNGLIRHGSSVRDSDGVQLHVTRSYVIRIRKTKRSSMERCFVIKGSSPNNPIVPAWRERRPDIEGQSSGEGHFETSE
jgi:hypothetical protein